MYILLVFDQTGQLTSPETRRLKIQRCCSRCYQVAVRFTLQIDYLTVNQRRDFFNGSGPTLECCKVHHRVNVQFVPHSLRTVHGASFDRRHHPVHHRLSVNLRCVAKGSPRFRDSHKPCITIQEDGNVGFFTGLSF